MSAKFIRRIVELGIAVFCIGGFLMIARAAAKVFDGKFGTVHWPVQAGAYDLQQGFGDQASIHFENGMLIMQDQPFWYGLDFTFSLGYIAIFIVALILLRTVLMRFTEGELVNTQNADTLRRIGLLLFSVCALSVVHVVIIQSAILFNIEAPAGTVLHPAISWDVKGMTNIWLHYDVPILTFALAGLAMLFAEAFRAGADYRKDSESVI